MKTKLLLVSICFLLLLSCNNINDRKLLSQLKELSVEYPDSALKLLDESFNPDLMSPENLADWCLMGVILRDSLKEDMDIDSTLFVKVISYYNEKRDEELRAKAWYYYGRTLAYNGNYSAAIPAYKNAIEYADLAGEYNIAGYGSSYLGDIYLRTYAPVEARKNYENAVEYFARADNKRSQGFGYRDIAITYFKNGEWDKTLEWLHFADSLNSEINDSILTSSLLNNYAAVYLKKEEYKLVDKYLNEYTNKFPGKMEIFNLLISNYLDQKRFNEARFYLDSLIHTASEKEKPYLLMRYYLLEKEVGNPSKALEYYESYAHIRNTLWEDSYSKDLIRIEKKYDRQRLINQNNQMKIKQQQYILVLVGFGLILAILIAITWIRNIKKKNKELKLINQLVRKEKELAEKKNVELELTNKVVIQEKELANKKNKELELNNRLVLKEKELTEKKNIELELTNKVVLQEKELADKENEILKMKAKEDQVSHIRDFLLEKSQLYTKLQIITDLPPGCKNKQMEFEKRVKQMYQAPSISNKDWENMRELMEKLSPDFILKLNASNIKNRTEINFCCLLRFGLPSDKMILLLNLTKESLKSKKYRVVKKLGIANTDAKLKAYLDEL